MALFIVMETINMSKKSELTSCPVCEKEITKRGVLRHLRLFHCDFYKEIEEEYKLTEDSCKSCGKKYFPYKNVNCFYFRYMKKEVCSRKCNIPWNVGQTKDTDSRLKKISESRMGKNNPIQKVISDPEKYKKWRSFFQSSSWKEKARINASGNMDERYGEEKATEIKNKINNTWVRNGKKPRGMSGKKHSDKTKDRLRQTTSAWLVRFKKTSILESKFYEKLCVEIPEIKFEHCYLAKYYTIDIAQVDFKIAIEVDGDFFHANVEKGYPCETKIQKKNLSNDKRKNAYLELKGWRVIRIWESDINEKPEEQINRIKDAIRELSGNSLC